MTYNHTQKRKMLTSALFQHSTKLQSFKTSALERIVERIMYFSKKKEKSITEIQLVFKEELGYNLPYSSFERYPFGKLHPLLILFDGQEFV